MRPDRFEKVMLERFDRLENKVDEITTKHLPELKLNQAVLKSEVTAEARQNSKIYALFWGGLTLAVSIAGVAVAYFK